MLKSMLSIGLFLGSLARLAGAGEFGETASQGTLSAAQYAALKAELEQKASADIARLRLKQILAHRADDKGGFLETMRQQDELTRQFLTEQAKLDQRFASHGNVIDKIKMGFSAKDVVKQIEMQRLATARQETLDRLRGQGKVDQNGKAVGETPAERAQGQLAVNRELAKARDAAQKQFREDLQVSMHPPPRRFTKSGKEIPWETKGTKPISKEEVANVLNDMTKDMINEARLSGQVSGETAAALKAAADSQRQTADHLREEEEAQLKLVGKFQEAQTAARDGKSRTR